MYACIKDPETGRNIYADIAVSAYVSGGPFKLESARTKDVITENEFADVVARELRGVKIKNPNLLNAVLKDYFNISVDTCPELIKAVKERLDMEVAQ